MNGDFVAISLMPLLIGTLASVACALLGSFLVLRRQSLISDAVAHVALPGIVGAFIVTGTLAAGSMIVGATITAIVAVLMIETIRKVGRIESGAAMGVVFTTLFAAGVVLLERTDTSSVHLDVEHALYGNLESLIWLAGENWGSLLNPAALAEIPPQMPRLAIVLLVIVGFIVVCWKELVVATFDAAFAESVGARPVPVGLALVVMVAVAAVAAFEAVGSIIVIAMFICPPAAARLMTDRMSGQMAWSVAFAVLSAVLGYVLAGYGPLWLGARSSVSAAGMIAAVSGVILACACLWGPKRHGVGGMAAR